MANNKRAYKLQEFVAHSDSVNCLKIGRKTSRVLATGGEDAKVNIWAIGKPNAILSLSGHTSAVESVNFDASEVLLAAGAASGTVKLWDLEEAKIVRTLTGHRSNCVSVDFHPFGEFFASGSLDTNLKLWDIRRKGCIHTYKGHTRGVNVVRFTPDGRWVVSGGEDNAVKIWDLTAGKLLHDFKLHDGQIQCIDFHPNEFLLATGSSDKSVKFWDLETFELIGSAGPEATGIRSMTFTPDGRTLLCGLQESLKVFSWEPIKCHDSVDVGWSRLSDMNIYDGKLLGCSYNRSCVGVWVVDLSRIEPSAKANSARLSSNAMSKSTLNGNLPAQAERVTKPSVGRLSLLQNLEPPAKENKPLASTGFIPATPQRIAPGIRSNVPTTNSSTEACTTPMRRGSAKFHASTESQSLNKTDIQPVIVPRTSSRADLSSDCREETGVGRAMPYSADSKFADFQKLNVKDDPKKGDAPVLMGLGSKRNTQLNELPCRNILASGTGVNQIENVTESGPGDFTRTGIGRLGVKRITESNTNFHHEIFIAPKHLIGGARSYEAGWKRRGSSAASSTPNPGTSSENVSAARSSYSLRGHSRCVEKENVSATDEDIIADLMEQHMQFLNSTQSRLTKLQVVLRLWDKKDVKGVITALERMPDYSVSADFLSFLKDRSDVLTLDLCTSLLPLLTHLLTSKMERHLAVSLEMLLKVVRTFGPVIHSALSAGPSVGVDIVAEQRLQRCTLCKNELEKIKQTLPPLTRRGGSITKAAIELNLALQEVL